MSIYWLLLLLPLAAASGFWFAIISRDTEEESHREKFPTFQKNYLIGLNYLINEEPDKALDLFIKMIEVDTETVETHLALGNLFRRRGETDRAIRLHQNLIARPNLLLEQRTQSVLALAQDYLHAGLLDRAERLFLELLDHHQEIEASLRALLDIYEQEKDWEKAIQLAKQFHYASKSIAHYYCELAEKFLPFDQDDFVEKNARQALLADENSARASLLLADLAMKKKEYKNAIRQLKHIREQDSELFPEAMDRLVTAHLATGQEEELIRYLKALLLDMPTFSIALVLSEQIQKKEGDKVAVDFIADYVRQYPSVQGLSRLLELYQGFADTHVQKDLLLLRKLIQHLIAKQLNYRCIQCGFTCKSLHWFCPSCKKWNTIKPTRLPAS